MELAQTCFILCGCSLARVKGDNVGHTPKMHGCVRVISYAAKCVFRVLSVCEISEY